jgi:hypothetical protein
MARHFAAVLILSGHAQALRVPRPQLRVAGRARAMMNPRGPAIPYALRTSHSTLYATDAAAAAVEPEPQQRGLKAILQSPETKKVVPLALIFFCILFNYTILRDTKDVLVVTAPKSGAEIIPFLKTYVNLPGAIAFTVLYGSLSNRFSQPQVFRGVVSTFLGFFACFAWVLYPNIGSLHPHGLADAAARILPGSFQAPIAVIRNWTFSLFYLAAELWGSVVASLLFWGFANSVLTQRLFLMFSELQGRVDGVCATPRHRGAVDVAVRESLGLMRVVSRPRPRGRCPCVAAMAPRGHAIDALNHTGRLRQRGQEVLPPLRFVCERRFGF